MEYTLARIHSSDVSEASLRKEQNREEEEARKKFNASIRYKPEMSKSKEKKAVWTSEQATLLPDFSYVRSNARSIEWWCEATKLTLKDYWGPPRAIVASIIQTVDLPEVHDPSFDSFAYTPDDLVGFIHDKWVKLYQRRSVPVILVKNRDETWGAYLARLRNWTTERNLKQEDAWYLDQMRANILAAQDKFPDVEKSNDWAEQMDAVEATYNRVQHKSVNAVATEDPVDEESVNAMTKGGRGTNPQRARSGDKGSRKPLTCYNCGGVGHKAYQCPSKKRFKGQPKSRKKLQVSILDWKR